MSLNDLPPETLQRNEYSSASDIWSTAVVMWQIISPGKLLLKWPPALEHPHFTSDILNYHILTTKIVITYDRSKTAYMCIFNIPTGCFPFKDDKVRLEHSYKFALDDDEQIKLRWARAAFVL